MFTGRVSWNAGGIDLKNVPFRFGCSKPFRRYSQSKPDVAKSRPKFCMFLATIFFTGGPQFFDLIRRFQPDSDHVAKIRGDRLSYLGDVAA